MAQTEHVTREALMERMDKLPMTRRHLAFILVMGFGLLFDMMETTMSTVLTTTFSAPGSGVSHGQLQSLLLGFFVGGAIGAPVLGRLGDRIGRRHALALIFAGFGLLTIATALARDFTALAVLRGCSGFLLAAGPPMIWITLADVLPARSRGKVMMMTAAFGTLGAALSSFVTNFAGRLQPLGLEGWRWALIVGGVAGLVLSLLVRRFPDSPRWLAANGRLVEAKAALAAFEASRPVGRPDIESPALPAANETPASPNASFRGFRGRFVLLFLLQTLQTLGIAGIAVLFGAIMVRKGFSVEFSTMVVGIAALGGPFGAILSSLLVDRVSRRPMFIALSLSIAATGLLFALTNQTWLLITAGITAQVLMVIYSTVLHIYGAEMFPTAIRSTAAGGAYAGNRIGGALIPLLLLPLLVKSGPTTVLVVIAGILALAALLAAIWGPEGKPATGLD